MLTNSQAFHWRHPTTYGEQHRRLTEHLPGPIFYFYLFIHFIIFKKNRLPNISNCGNLIYLTQARFSAPDLRTLVTYATSHSELTGVTTAVLFHDTHPPVVFFNELDVAVTYMFQEPVKGKTIVIGRDRRNTKKKLTSFWQQVTK
jgi:hypothetical protein